LAPRLVTKSIQKRQSHVLPTMVGPSKSRPPMSHRKTDLGIPSRSRSAKVVLERLELRYRQAVRLRTPPSIPQSSASSRLLSHAHGGYEEGARDNGRSRFALRWTASPLSKACFDLL
jgi:hypothetical protein